LAAFNEDLTGIPWIAGFAMATMLATIITVVADRTVFAGQGRRRLGSFGRAIIIWAVAFLVLSVVMSAATSSGAALVLVPFFGASLVTLFAEGARRALRGPHRS
jgi:hypothetical protein